jgi:hypothetical protein
VKLSLVTLVKLSLRGYACDVSGWLMRRSSTAARSGRSRTDGKSEGEVELRGVRGAFERGGGVVGCAAGAGVADLAGPVGGDRAWCIGAHGVAVAGGGRVRRSAGPQVASAFRGWPGRSCRVGVFLRQCVRAAGGAYRGGQADAEHRRVPCRFRPGVAAGAAGRVGVGGTSPPGLRYVSAASTGPASQRLLGG